MSIKPTKRQADYLTFIHEHTRDTGRVPTRAEIGEALGVELPAALRMLKTLEREGWLELNDGEIRASEPGEGGPGPLDATMLANYEAEIVRYFCIGKSAAMQNLEDKPACYSPSPAVIAHLDGTAHDDRILTIEHIENGRAIVEAWGGAPMRIVMSDEGGSEVDEDATHLPAPPGADAITDEGVTLIRWYLAGMLSIATERHDEAIKNDAPSHERLPLLLTVELLRNALGDPPKILEAYALRGQRLTPDPPTA